MKLDAEPLYDNSDHMDKTITDVKLPALSVSIKASPAVKDICIDEGAQMFEKILVEFDKIGPAVFSSSKFPTVNGNSARGNENSDDLKPSSTNEGLGSSPEISDSTTCLNETIETSEFAVTCNETNGASATSIDGNEKQSSDGTASARSSFSHHSHGNSNPVEPATLSGSITSSHMPYSGNISLRSESSTTSGQSFAFPVLQPEWSNSPVRMAKAERRHLRRHRWVNALTCCKF